MLAIECWWAMLNPTYAIMVESHIRGAVRHGPIDVRCAVRSHHVMIVTGDEDAPRMWYAEPA